MEQRSNLRDAEKDLSALRQGKAMQDKKREVVLKCLCTERLWNERAKTSHALCLLISMNRERLLLVWRTARR